MTAAEPDPVEPADSEPDGRLEAYRHDAGLVPALARLADAACDGADDPHTAGWLVEQVAAEMDSPVPPAAITALTTAFLYTLTHAEVPQAGTTLTPMDGTSLFPVPLREVPDEVRDAWLALASEVTHPVARARLHDLVFTLRLMRNGRHAAEQAARAYLDGVGGGQRMNAQVSGVVRAWSLTRSVRSTALEREITELMLDMTVGMIDRGESPFVVIPMLCALASPLSRGSTARAVDSRVDEVLDRALSTCSQTRALKHIAAIVRKRAGTDTARVEAANRRLVEMMLADAHAATEPMVIRKLFGDAASVARQLELADLEKIAIASLQSAPALTWESTKYSVDIPASFFDVYLPGFDTAADWREALRIWLSTESPTGRHETNLAMTQQALQHSVMHRLISTVVFREGDMPARTLSNHEEFFTRELANVELLYLGTYGIFLADALARIADRFGIPPREELVAFLCKSGGDPALLNTLADAFQQFWVAQYDAALHLAVPKVEATARALLLEINEPVYRTAVGETTGQFPGLGALLPPLLDNGLDPDWERFLRTFLLGDGANVRNLAAHGYLHDVGPLHAAAALRAMAVLTLITSEPAVQRDVATIKVTLANPIRKRRRTWRQRFTAAWHELRRH